jgi:hypothetical protein
MSTPLDSSPSPETKEVGDPAPDQTTRTPVRSVYLKVLAAVVVMTILGSPTLARLAEMLDLGSLRGLHASMSWAAMALVLGTMILAPIAVIRLRLQGREVSRSYGVAALVASALGVGFAATSVLFSFLIIRNRTRGLYWQQWPGYLEHVARNAAEFSAVAITAAWLILALIGAGRKPCNGFEWLGLGLGLLWMLTYVGRYVLEIVPWLL